MHIVSVGSYVKRNARGQGAWCGAVEYISGSADVYVERRPSGVVVLPGRPEIVPRGRYRWRYQTLHPDGKVFRLYEHAALVNVVTDGQGRPLRKPVRKVCPVHWLVHLELAQVRSLS